MLLLQTGTPEDRGLQGEREEEDVGLRAQWSRASANLPHEFSSQQQCQVAHNHL